ncbi:M23 family metallopeptidase [Solimonas marina]|uniref:Peptidoglycan DD-metalloendopeptidase family protein n=1 Tax=Solimonas marina TaxID=2714601 RepID=A0A969WF47_9GAMM|nr:M23 family metallopeptidase [Solimonas marina]NKF24166.1 peptidoglycan DD-metalloendopeptidase family protein [Solimonas marina]
MRRAGVYLAAAIAAATGTAFANNSNDGVAAVAKDIKPEDCKAQTLSVTRGDSAYTLLRSAGVDAGDVMRWLHASADAKTLREMRPGDTLSICTAAQLDGRRELQRLTMVHHHEQTALAHPPATDDDDVRIVHVGFTIDHTLASALRAAHVRAPLASAVHAYLRHDDDLPAELPKGARVVATFAGAPSEPHARLLCLDVTLHTRHHRIYHYVGDDGAQYLVGRHGHGVKLLAMLQPLPHARISSGWGWRINPVLKTPEFHKGIDYAAPLGTPIRAALDGTVGMAQWHGNYGRVVEIRSGHGVATRYGHLHSIASGIHSGSHVHAGQIIGYVGSTGLSTGPHLYFELWEHDQRLNPLLNVPAESTRLSHAERSRFDAYVHRLEARVPVG